MPHVHARALSRWIAVPADPRPTSRCRRGFLSPSPARTMRSARRPQLLLPDCPLLLSPSPSRSVTTRPLATVLHHCPRRTPVYYRSASDAGLADCSHRSSALSPSSLSATLVDGSLARVYPLQPSLVHPRRRPVNGGPSLARPSRDGRGRARYSLSRALLLIVGEWPTNAGGAIPLMIAAI